MKLVFVAFLLAVATQSAEPIRTSAGSTNTNLLMTESSVQTLTEAISLSLQRGLTLNLEPGIRLNRIDETYTLASYDGRNVEIVSGSDLVSLSSPVTIVMKDTGWVLNGTKTVNPSSFTVRRPQAQDDAD